MNEAIERWISEGVWQAGIARVMSKMPDKPGDSIWEAATTEEAAREALPKRWVVVGPEDKENGIWLVIPSSRVRNRLEQGHEYRWRNRKNGWKIEINQP